MSNPTPRVRVPKSARRGERITIKTLVPHEMESGHRRNASGALVPRRIINRFVCRYNGKTVFDGSLEPAIAANPFIEFELRVDESGTLEFEWTEDGGRVFHKTATIDAV